jgi:hypothetical protein
MNKAFEDLYNKLEELYTRDDYVNVTKHEMAVVKRALDVYQTILYEKIPDTPFICGKGGKKNDVGMPEYFFICPTYGVDAGLVYNYKRVDREDIKETAK